MADLRIGVFGAGAIGGYVGTRLAAAGFPVVLVGRGDLASTGGALTAIDLEGQEHRAQVAVTTDPAALAATDVCLVTVKSGDSPAAGRLLAEHLPPATVVVSLQNGIRNTNALGGLLQRSVVPGMVTYNVRRESPARFRKATSGPIMTGRGEGPQAAIMLRLAEAFARAGEPIELRADMDAVQLTKLLLNLNNGLCALTGLSLATSLRSRSIRRAFSACLAEGVRVARANGLALTRIGPLAPSLVARLLDVPDFLFFRLASSMMAIDPAARSSTLQDIDRGKLTEIDFLSGEIVGLARRAGLDAPANHFVTEQVHRLERAGRPPPFLSAEDLWAGIQRALGASTAAARATV